MHDILICVAFLSMIIAPCLVASKSGSSESEQL